LRDPRIIATTGWTTDEYNQANFGSIKPGMGILINLGAPTKVGAVKVMVSQQGAAMELRAGTSDPGNTSEGDKTISTSFTSISTPNPQAGTNIVFAVPQDKQTVQYLLVWITKLPPDDKGKFTIAIKEITLYAP